ncbi:CPBP family intramembrane glutamic endopeptidase [Pantoea sp. 1.19]|uniref:CPBP family intramembrane glutamic endopeptidase n=1 Tax=Pantoea sp. 1.19 TaxID=1925589 RepID=UPI000948978F|nr:CPBP family intramembrane glutamic endopeptidase [Pantoea sp. 1.19]
MWLLLAIALGLLFVQRTLATGLAGVAVLLGWWQGSIALSGVLILIAGGMLARGHALLGDRPRWQAASEALLVLLCAGLFLHLLPGFTNLKVVDSVAVGPQSAPASLWFNLDKAMVPFLLAAMLPGVLARTPARPVGRRRWLLLALSVPALLLLAVALGGLRLEPHLPAWLPQFVLANLFFVSLAEEALFRGWLQSRLQACCGGWGGLLLASLLFGLAHLAGGPLLVAFAALAGVIYGLAWWWSGRLWVATLFHFSLNLIHLLCFTWPVWRPA